MGWTTTSLANASMGIALEQYDPRAWAVYVVAIVLLEAWLIGRAIGRGPAASLFLSLLANFLTAGLGASICGVGLHQSFVGPRIDPNPLMNLLVMMTVFSLISGMLEYVVWRSAARSSPPGAVFRPVMMAHAVGAFLGVLILLVPARPYPFLESYTDYARRFPLMNDLGEELLIYIDRHGTFPPARSAPELVESLLNEENLPLSYRATFGRFATRDSRTQPLELNPALPGKKVVLGEDDPTWILRTREGNRCWGYGTDWTRDRLNYISDCKALGY